MTDEKTYILFQEELIDSLIEENDLLKRALQYKQHDDYGFKKWFRNNFGWLYLPEIITTH